MSCALSFSESDLLLRFQDNLTRVKIICDPNQFVEVYEPFAVDCKITYDFFVGYSEETIALVKVFIKTVYRSRNLNKSEIWPSAYDGISNLITFSQQKKLTADQIIITKFLFVCFRFEAKTR